MSKPERSKLLGTLRRLCKGKPQAIIYCHLKEDTSRDKAMEILKQLKVKHTWITSDYFRINLEPTMF